MVRGGHQDMKGKQFKIVLPVEMKDWLAERAKENLRSISGEIILAIREQMDRVNEDGT